MSAGMLSEIRRNRVVVMLGTALMAVLIVLAFVWFGGSRERALAQAEADALEAAKTSAVAMTTYDYRRLDKDYAWADDGATESFATQYRDASLPLREIIEKLKATARGTVSEAAATALDTSEVEVLVFIDQKITNESGGDARTDRSRVVMTMVEVDDRWLVDDVQLR